MAVVGCVSAAIATTGSCRRAAAATRRCSVASRVVVAMPVCRVVAFVVHGNKGGQLEQASQVVPRVVASNKVVSDCVCVCVYIMAFRTPGGVHSLDLVQGVCVVSVAVPH